MASGDPGQVTVAGQTPPAVYAVTGDLAGTLPSPTVAKLRGSSVASTAPTSGQVLVWSAADGQWEPRVGVDTAGIPALAASRIDPNLAVARRNTSPLTIPTGFSGNDIVEPELLYDPDATLWGHRYLLIAAPYFNSNGNLENPSLWISDDGNTWTVPSGVTNPIYPVNIGGAGYGPNSDPSILIGNDGLLYMLFNQFGPSSTWLVKAASCPPSNLAGWDASPAIVVNTAVGTTRPTSPSGFYDPALGTYVFYSIDIDASPKSLQRWTSPNPKTAWTQSTAPTFPTWPASSREMWHLNAYLIGDQHVLLISDTASGGSGPGHLYLATSNDRGSTWTVGQQPLIYGTGSSSNWDNGLYRSAMLPTWRGDEFTLDLFYGGNTNTNTWGIGRTTISFNRAYGCQSVITGSSLYYGHPYATPTTVQYTANDMRSGKITFDRTVTLSEIGVEVTTIGDVVATYRLGIYADTGDGVPGRLILDAGNTTAMSTTGYYPITISKVLPAGSYWVTGVPQNVTTTWPTVRASGFVSAPGVGSSTALTVTQNATGGWRNNTGITGALPDPFNNGVPLLSSSAPRVIVKVT